MLYPLSYEGGAGADRGAEVPGPPILGGPPLFLGWLSGLRPPLEPLGAPMHKKRHGLS